MEKHNKNRSESEKVFSFQTESATATVIGAVLLLGIIFSVLTIICVFCIPEWKSDAEYSHMGDICDDMAEVKSKIDMMSIILASSPNSSSPNSPDPSSSAPQLIVSVPFHMGGGDLPLIGPIKSSGSLAVNRENCKMGVVVVSSDDSTTYSINCGTITYNSQNRYYVDQNLSYENGALILNQREQSVMTLYPSIRFSRALDNASNVINYNVSINAVRIFQKPYAPPEAISSNTGCSLRLTGIDYTPWYDSNKVGKNLKKLELTVYTKNPDAWEQYFKKATKDANIDPGKDCDIVPGEQKLHTDEKIPFVRLTFPKETSKKGLKGLYIGETVVKAEPGIGLH
jgi:hypothetical protein